MASLSHREIVLVCSPLLILAVVGFLLSRRKTPSPGADKLHLEFHVEKPTALEAFQGADAVIVLALKGTNADKHSLETFPFLEVKTASGTQTSHVNNGYSGFWAEVWKGNINGTRFPINSKAIPAGKLSFGASAKVVPQTGGAVVPVPVTWLHLSGKWTLHREKITPFPFEKMARQPLTVLRSVQIIQVVPGAGIGMVTGECAFDLTGAAMNARTPVEMHFSGGGFSTKGGSSSGMSWDGASVPLKNPRQRLQRWTVSSVPAPKTIGRVTGRVSANQRWPLAFQIEPFDLAKVKVGQKLKFRSWAVNAPISKEFGEKSHAN